MSELTAENIKLNLKLESIVKLKVHDECNYYL